MSKLASRNRSGIENKFHVLGMFSTHRKIAGLVFLNPGNPQRQWKPLSVRPLATLMR